MSNDIANEVKSIIQQQWELSADQLASDTTFESLGFDSLDAAELMTLLEEAFSVRFPRQLISQVNTVDQLVMEIKRLKRARVG